MPTILERLRTLVESNINDLLRRAQDPVKAYDLELDKMRQAVREAEEAYQVAYANEVRLEKQVEVTTAEVQKYDADAELAAKAGNRDLCEQAEERLVDAQERLKALVQSEHDAEQQRLQLKQWVEPLRSKLEKLVRNRESILARWQAAKAVTAAQEVIASIDQGKIDGATSEITSRVELEEARAEAAMRQEAEAKSYEQRMEEIRAQGETPAVRAATRMAKYQ